MTPKEKAVELYNKYYFLYTHPHSVEVRKNEAQACALIAVDEILDPFRKVLPSSRKYWQEVKTEIEKL